MGISGTLKQTLAVARKDLRSELRTRYALSSLGMFVLVTVAVIAFSTGDEQLGGEVGAGLIWVTMFFTAVTGLGRSFVSEEERGTSLLLRLCVSSGPVYLGKLIVNVILAVAANTLISFFFLLLINGVRVGSPGAFMLVILASSLGFAAALTIIAAIIARASAKSALYPVLAFPIVLPLVLLGVDLLGRSMEKTSIAALGNDLLMLGLYTGSLIILSYVLFDILWKE